MTPHRISDGVLIEPGETRRQSVTFPHFWLYEGRFCVANSPSLRIVEVRLGNKPLGFTAVTEAAFREDDEDACRAFTRVEANQDLFVFVKNEGPVAFRFSGSFL